MPATIEYEVDGETHSITREEYHTDVDGYVTAYNNGKNTVERKVKVPEHRVVVIYENDG